MIKKYPGDFVFQKKLDEKGIILNCYEIKMFLAGVLLALELVPPSAVIKEVIYIEGGEEPMFEDEDDYMEFMNIFLGLWNLVADYSGSASRYPKLSPMITNFQSRDEKIKFIIKKSEELTMFYLGLEFSEADLLFDHCFELLKTEMSLSVMHELFVDFTTSYDLKEKITDEDISELLEVAADFEKRWPIAYPQLNKIFTDIRLGKTQLDSEEEMNSKLDKFTEEIKGRGLTQKMIFSTRCNFQK